MFLEISVPDYWSVKNVGEVTSGIDSYTHDGDLHQVERSFSCKIGRIQPVGAVLLGLAESKNVFWRLGLVYR